MHVQERLFQRVAALVASSPGTYQHVRINPDGNCMFSALAHELYRDASRHVEVRQKICQLMVILELASLHVLLFPFFVWYLLTRAYCSSRRTEGGGSSVLTFSPSRIAWKENPTISSTKIMFRKCDSRESGAAFQSCVLLASFGTCASKSGPVLVSFLLLRLVSRLLRASTSHACT